MQRLSLRKLLSVLTVELLSFSLEVFVLSDSLAVDLVYTVHDVALHLEVELVRSFFLPVLNLCFLNAVRADFQIALFEEFPGGKDSLPATLSGQHHLTVLLNQILLCRKSVL